MRTFYDNKGNPIATVQGPTSVEANFGAPTSISTTAIRIMGVRHNNQTLAGKQRHNNKDKTNS